MSIFNRLFGGSKITVVRDKSGNWVYDNVAANWNNQSYQWLYNNVSIIQNSVNYGANYLSKFKFGVQLPDGSIDYENDLLKWFEAPNQFVSKEDYLKEHYIFRKVSGYVYEYPAGSIGFQDRAEYIYNLNPAHITHNYSNKPYLAKDDTQAKMVLNQDFQYQDGSDTKSYKYGEVIKYYDTTNGLNTCELNNPFISQSVLKSLNKEITNIIDGLTAENKALKSIGERAMFKESSKGGSKDGWADDDYTPMSTDEKKKLEAVFNNPSNKTHLAQVPLQMTDFAIGKEQLGKKLNESINRNKGDILAAFGLSNELYNFLNTGAKFADQERQEVRFIDTYIRPIADDIASSRTKFLGNYDTPFVATIDNAAVMQVAENRKAEKAKAHLELISNTMATLDMTRQEAIEYLNNNYDINLQL